MEQTSNRSVLFWIIVGLVVGVLIQASQARFTGNWTGLLAAGSDSPLLPVLNRELPGLVVTQGEGHDGQATYGVALDPYLQNRPSVVPDASYRYRRILLPLLGSGFGALRGRALLTTLTTLNLLGFALASWGSARIAQTRRLPGWVVLAALVNIGLWLSLQTTTPDALALGFTMMAVALSIQGRHLVGALLVAAAALTKETYALVAMGLAGWAWFSLGNRRAATQYGIAAVPAALWAAFLAFALGEGLATGGNLSWPFAGIIASAPTWVEAGTRDQLFTAIASITLVGSLFVVARVRHRLWSYLIIPWAILALVSSHWIWDLGNNSLRALAPLFTFGLLGFFDRSKSPQLNTSLRNLPV